MRTVVRRTLLLIAIALPLLLALLVYLLHQPDFVSRQLDRQLAAATGWRLETSGGLVLDWGRTSVIEARDLRVSNPGWSLAEELFTAAGLRLEFQPLELLHGRLDMRQLSLRDCRLKLDQDAEGRSNWSIANEPDAEDETSFGWSLSRLDIEHCTIQRTAAGQQQVLKVRLDQAQLQVDEQQEVELSIKGALDQQDLTLEGSLQPVQALWQGGPLQHSLNLQAGEVRLHSEGSVASLGSGADASLKFHFSGPEFARITEWLALPEFSRGKFDANISVQRQASGTNLEIGIDADLGDLEIKGDGELDKLRAPSQGRLALQAIGPDLEALGRTLGVEGLLAQPFEVDLQAAIASGATQLDKLRISSMNDSLQARGSLGPWPAFKGSDLEIDLALADLLAWLPNAAEHNWRFHSLDSHIRLLTDAQSQVQFQAQGLLGQQDGETRHDFALAAQALPQHQGLRLDQFELQLGADRLAMSGDLKLPDNFADSEVQLELQLADLADSGQWLGLANLPARNVHLQAKLSRPGKGLKFEVTADRATGQKVHISGDVPDLRNILALDAEFDIDLPSLQLAQFLVPGTGLPDLPFAARGKVVNNSAAQLTRVQDLAISLGRSKAELQAELHLQQQMEGSTASWTLHSPDWRELCAGYCEAIPLELQPGAISGSGRWRRSSGADHFDGLDLETNLARIKASGRIAAQTQGAESPAQREMRFNLDIQGANASQLNPLLGPLFDQQGFSLQSTLNIEPERIHSPDIRFRQGKTALSAEVDMALAERPAINARVRSEVLDLTAFRQQFVEKRAAGSGEPAPAAATGQRKLLFPDEAIELLDELPVNLSLDLEIDQLLLGAVGLKQLRLQGDWLPESLQVSGFEFSGASGGHYAGNFTARQSGGITGLALHTRADDLKLGLIGVSGQDPETLPPSDIELDLTGQGKTWHELAQTLTGKARLYAGAGRVSDTGLNFLFNDLLTQVFNTLNPLSKSSQYTELACGVYAADFHNGKVSMAPIVIQTGQITAFSTGEVDLATEAISLNFHTVPRKGLGISAGSVVNPFFKIGGTLMKPALQVDVTKGAISGGAMVATVGLSVLFKSLSDRLLASKDPCGDARAEIEQADSASRP